MAPEPCDTAELAPANWAVVDQRARRKLGVSPCGPLDILGQGAGGRPVRDIDLAGRYL